MADPNGSNHTLTEGQQQALFIHQKRRWAASQAKVDEATGARKALEKIAKDDLGKNAVKDIKDAIKLETPAGEAEVRGEIERRQNVFRMMAVDTQLSMVDGEQPTPDAKEQAYREGQQAGMHDEPAKSPHAPVELSNQWLEGHQQGVMLMAWARKMDDERAFDEGARVTGGGGTTPADDAGEDIGDQPDTAQVVQ